MAALNRILVPMDGSPLSKEALRVTLEEYPGVETVVLHVINPAEPGYSYPIDEDSADEPLHGSEAWYARSEDLAKRLFTEVEEIVATYDVEVPKVTRVGEAGREIIEYAVDHDVGQIVIGGHGRTDEERHLLGSVTETVVFRSPVRVLIVR
jgi:nucleotide-binding universal stress UspA family protein